MFRKLEYKSQENLSRTGIIDARARYRAVAWRLRNTYLKCLLSHYAHTNMEVKVTL